MEKLSLINSSNTNGVNLREGKLFIGSVPVTSSVISNLVNESDLELELQQRSFNIWPKVKVNKGLSNSFVNMDNIGGTLQLDFSETPSDSSIYKSDNNSNNVNFSISREFVNENYYEEDFNFSELDLTTTAPIDPEYIYNAFILKGTTSSYQVIRQSIKYSSPTGNKNILQQLQQNSAISGGNSIIVKGDKEFNSEHTSSGEVAPPVQMMSLEDDQESMARDGEFSPPSSGGFPGGNSGGGVNPGTSTGGGTGEISGEVIGSESISDNDSLTDQINEYYLKIMNLKVNQGADGIALYYELMSLYDLISQSSIVDIINPGDTQYTTVVNLSKLIRKNSCCHLTVSYTKNGEVSQRTLQFNPCNDELESNKFNTKIGPSSEDPDCVIEYLDYCIRLFPGKEINECIISNCYITYEY